MSGACCASKMVAVPGLYRTFDFWRIIASLVGAGFYRRDNMRFFTFFFNRLRGCLLSISCLSAENRASLNVDYNVIALKEWVLALFLPEAPTEMLAILDQAAKDVVLGLFPQYERIAKEIHVRITDLPLMEDIRSLRWVHARTATQ